MIRWLLIGTTLLLSCTGSNKISAEEQVNHFAEEYVRLGLYIGAYDGDFVDAYYGPDSLKPVAVSAQFPKDSLLSAAERIAKSIGSVKASGSYAETGRLNWLLQQLKAFSERIRIYAGETQPFDQEAAALFGTKPPHYDDRHYRNLVAQLDSLLPGTGPVDDRMKMLTSRFVIPKVKIDTVFKAAIAEARRRTKEHYALPESEDFRLEYVTGKSWSGYNWYKGNYQSLIQINVEAPINIERAIDLACHEGYPGHHVYNMLLEQNLYRGKGWVEISLYPLFSPQSLVAEGSANYGIDLAFPGTEKNQFIKSVLLPLAELDTSYLDRYLEALSITRKLNYLRNEVAAALLSGVISEDEAAARLVDLGMMGKETAARSVRFIKKYRSYVINYNYGLDLVAKYIESGKVSDKERWNRFYHLLSNPVTTNDLLEQ